MLFRIIAFLLLLISNVWAATITPQNPVTPPVQIICMRDANGQVTGTTAQTPFPGSSCTIPARALNNGNIVQLTSIFNVPTQVAGTNTISVRLGGTTIYTYSGITSIQAKQLDLTIFAPNTSTQTTFGVFHPSSSTGLGGTPGTVVTTNVDTSVDQTLDITVQLGDVGNIWVLNVLIVKFLQL